LDPLQLGLDWSVTSHGGNEPMDRAVTAAV